MIFIHSRPQFDPRWALTILAFLKLHVQGLKAWGPRLLAKLSISIRVLVKARRVQELARAMRVHRAGGKARKTKQKAQSFVKSCRS